MRALLPQKLISSQRTTSDIIFTRALLPLKFLPKHFLKCYLKKFGQRGGTSWWRVCYERGLPRLDYQHTNKQTYELKILYPPCVFAQTFVGFVEGTFLFASTKTGPKKLLSGDCHLLLIYLQCFFSFFEFSLP